MIRNMSLTELEKYPIHPDAEIFRMMTEEETLTLAEDLAKNGMVDAITTLNGQLLDGRNRREAARRAGLEEVPVLEFQGNDTLALVISKNLARRNLTKYDLVEVGAVLRRQYEGRPGGAFAPGGERASDGSGAIAGRTSELVSQDLNGAIGISTLYQGWALMDRYPETWKEAKRTGEGIETAFKRATSPKIKDERYLTRSEAQHAITQGEALVRAVSAWRRSVGTTRDKMNERQLVKVQGLVRKMLEDLTQMSL